MMIRYLILSMLCGLSSMQAMEYSYSTGSKIYGVLKGSDAKHFLQLYHFSRESRTDSELKKYGCTEKALKEIRNFRKIFKESGVLLCDNQEYDQNINSYWKMGYSYDEIIFSHDSKNFEKVKDCLKKIGSFVELFDDGKKLLIFRNAVIMKLLDKSATQKYESPKFLTDD